jgi:hypothetical protein
VRIAALPPNELQVLVESLLADKEDALGSGGFAHNRFTRVDRMPTDAEGRHPRELGTPAQEGLARDS